jgi:hypothetical protein
MRIIGVAFLVLCGFLLVTATPAFSHHSFMSEYDLNKPITLNGVVTRFVWSNPHALFNIDVRDSNGKVTNWTLETACPNALLNRGWSRSSLKAGDRITVQAYAAKKGTPVAATRTVILASGQKLDADSDGIRP